VPPRAMQLRLQSPAGGIAWMTWVARAPVPPTSLLVHAFACVCETLDDAAREDDMPFPDHCTASGDWAALVHVARVGCGRALFERQRAPLAMASWHRAFPNASPVAATAASFLFQVLEEGACTEPPQLLGNAASVRVLALEVAAAVTHQWHASVRTCEPPIWLREMEEDAMCDFLPPGMNVAARAVPSCRLLVVSRLVIPRTAFAEVVDMSELATVAQDIAVSVPAMFPAVPVLHVFAKPDGSEDAVALPVVDINDPHWMSAMSGFGYTVADAAVQGRHVLLQNWPLRAVRIRLYDSSWWPSEMPATRTAAKHAAAPTKLAASWFVTLSQVYATLHCHGCAGTKDDVLGGGGV
jgi:hypothetical protein